MDVELIFISSLAISRCPLRTNHPIIMTVFHSLQEVQLDWYPITRDASVYASAVIGLIWILLDDKVMWYEALALVAAYFLYITREFKSPLSKND